MSLPAIIPSLIEAARAAKLLTHEADGRYGISKGATADGTDYATTGTCRYCRARGTWSHITPEPCPARPQPCQECGSFGCVGHDCEVCAPAAIPAPPADRVPTHRSDDCRYCDRYGHACGRHEADDALDTEPDPADDAMNDCDACLAQGDEPCRPGCIGQAALADDPTADRYDPEAVAAFLASMRDEPAPAPAEYDRVMSNVLPERASDPGSIRDVHGNPAIVAPRRCTLNK